MLQHLSYSDYSIIALCALLVGISKTGIPGMGILVVPLLASVLPAKVSVGVLLPMLIFADLFAVSYYRRNAVWRHLIRLLPWAVIGVIIGYLLLDKINNQQLKPIIGGIVLVLLILNYFRNNKLDEQDIPSDWYFAAVLGLLAGITTMLANAAGPIMMIYLLAMRLPKQEFIGTGAWYFFLLNWFKVPFSINLGMINFESFKLDLICFPIIAIGAISGIYLLKRIPQKFFNNLIQILAALAALKLIFS